jgi:predicted hydrocarbon binding protein
MISSLNSTRFKDEIGEIQYFGQKVVMLRRDAFALMRKELMRLGAADAILRIAGRRVGVEEGKALSTMAETLGLKSQQSLPSFIRVAVEETNMGYGKIKVDDVNIESGTVNVSLSNSFEAETAERSRKPTCVFTLGYLEGIFSQLIGKDLRGRETTCKGKNDDDCRFSLSGPQLESGPLIRDASKN